MRPQILSFYCTVKDTLGNTLSSSFNRDVRTPSSGDGIPAPPDPTFGRVVEALQGMRRGQKRRIHIRAEEAYGLYDDRLLMTVPRMNLEEVGKLTVGQEVLAETEDGDQKVFRITDLNRADVTLDGNHPLAGKDLVVELKVTAQKEAPSDYMAHNWLSDSGQVLH